MILTAIFANLIAPYTYQEQNYEALKQSPSLDFLFGTEILAETYFQSGSWSTDLYDGRVLSCCGRDGRGCCGRVGLRFFYGKI
ncbi:MAG: hypothetical protein CM1200mP35_07940 [Chloroflexota bacterium]|nr:MAG: hypothetical protein CM1200mP35_07940 [Chloroflexota bacterium]